VEAALVKLTLPALWEREEGYIARVQQLEQQVADLQEQLQNMAKYRDWLLNQPILKSLPDPPTQDVNYRWICRRWQLTFNGR
jgi:hypothetical protein